MEKLKALHDALQAGLRRGAIIDERTGETRAVEVVAAEGEQLLALARVDEDDGLRPLTADCKVRIELPQDTSVIYVAGRISGVKNGGSTAELTLVCKDGAENRQRRMDIRVDAECRIRVGGDGLWEDARTVNLSAGGALVVSELNAKEGDFVEVELDLGGTVVKGRAEVIRRGVKTHGVGSRTSAALRFVGLPEELRERLSIHVLRAQALEKLRHRR